MNQLHIIVTRTIVRQIVHRRDCGVLEPSIFRNSLVQLNIPIAGCTWQPRDTLVACDARGVLRLLERNCRRFRVGAELRADLRADLLAEEVHDWTCDSRHAGTNDSNIAFEPAPERNVVIMVGDVGQLTERCKVAESYYTADSDEEADEEGGQDPDFASSILDLKAQDLRDREEEDQNIEAVERRVQVSTVSQTLRLPVVSLRIPYYSACH